MISASKKIDYGILLMASLPEYGEKSFRSLQDIAQEKRLSAGFLSQVMIPLKKAGLVQSKEGMNGGYQLSKPSEQITLCEIYEAIDGPIKLTACQNEQKQCVSEKKCPTKRLWTDLQQLMNGYLRQRNLSEFRNT